MNAILEKLALYWAYPFVRYALIVGVLIALCSSLLGVTLVLKRFSFIGDGLSHVAFGAMAIAAVLQITNKMPLVMVITILSARSRYEGMILCSARSVAPPWAITTSSAACVVLLMPVPLAPLPRDSLSPSSLFRNRPWRMRQRAVWFRRSRI